MGFYANGIQIGGTVQEREVVTYGRDQVIWFKIKATRKIKETTYTTVVPAKVRASEWTLKNLIDGSHICLIGRLNHSEHSGLYATPVERLQVWNSEENIADADPEFLPKIGTNVPERTTPKSVRDVGFSLPRG